MCVRVCAALTKVTSQLVNDPVETCFEPRTDAGYRVNGKVRNAEATWNVMNRQHYYDLRTLHTHTHVHTARDMYSIL